MKFRLDQFVVDAVAVEQKIRQAVARFHFKIFISLVLAQRAVAIVNANLRDYRESEFSDRVETKQVFRDWRQNVQPEKIHQPVRTGSKTKEAIGRAQQAPGVFQPLLVVSFQQPFTRLSANDER